MAATAPYPFDDAAAYERYMGRWSRAVAPIFLGWLDAPERARWLDVGCGTGILSEAVADLCNPAGIVGIDPSAAQIAEASRGRLASRACFHEADAMAIPHADASFDVVASALVINFIPDPGRAIKEMHRVVRRPGLIGGYVWDFANDLSPSGPLRRAMRSIGVEAPTIPGIQHSSLDALRAMFEHAGCGLVDTRTIEVTRAYASFDEFWTAQTPSYAPTTRTIEAMSPATAKRLLRALHDSLPAAENGKVEYAARAHAIKGSSST